MRDGSEGVFDEASGSREGVYSRNLEPRKLRLPGYRIKLHMPDLMQRMLQLAEETGTLWNTLLSRVFPSMKSE